jgi:hypothetical protein
VYGTVKGAASALLARTNANPPTAQITIPHPSQFLCSSILIIVSVLLGEGPFERPACW